MRKRLYIITTVLAALAYVNASADVTATHSEASTTESFAQEDFYDNVSDRDADNGIGVDSMLASLLMGVVGGFAGAFVFKVLGGSRKSCHRHESYSREESKKISAVRSQTADASHLSRISDKKESIAESQPSKTIAENQNKPTLPQQPPVADKKPSVKLVSEAVNINQTKIAYGDIMIHSANLMIIEDASLSDNPGDFPFKVEIDIARGTATYTFSPGILPSLINKLSTYEPMVETYDNKLGARTVKVEQPGILHHMDGYWKVEKKITVSLN